MPSILLPPLTVEDAFARIVAWLRNPNRNPNAVTREPIASTLDMQAVLDAVVAGQPRPQEPGRYMLDTDTNASPFHTAAWELCRRGILRPRVMRGSDNPSLWSPPPYGWFFDVTPYGSEWLAKAEAHAALPADYTRYAELLASHGVRFGPGYLARSREAVRCYQAQTYLAACVMCGAAAESILLALAVARSGDENRILNDYRGGSGRSRLEQFLLGQQPPAMREAFATYTELLKYWRDDAAHGTAVDFDEEEAFTALILLLRFARFADARWDALTTRAGGRGGIPQRETSLGPPEPRPATPPDERPLVGGRDLNIPHLPRMPPSA